MHIYRVDCFFNDNHKLIAALTTIITLKQQVNCQQCLQHSTIYKLLLIIELDLLHPLAAYLNNGRGLDKITYSVILTLGVHDTFN